MKYRIFPLGDSALTVEFGNQISVGINDRVLLLAGFIEGNKFEGFIETVSAYSSLTIFYNTVKVRKNFPEFQTAFDKVVDFLETAVKDFNDSVKLDSRKIEIPVCFDEEFAPDFEVVAALQNLSLKKAIEIFVSRTYRVFMLGFLPGFSYMGEVDERIAAPRKRTPRLNISQGSVGIAGRQTGIYSLDSPGGWQIIGRTPVKLFTPDERKLTLLQSGDSVNFFEISKREFLKTEKQKS